MEQEVKKELDQAQAHLGRAVGHVRELGELWLKEGSAIGQRALELTSDSLRQAASAVDEVRRKLG